MYSSLLMIIMCLLANDDHNTLYLMLIGNNFVVCTNENVIINNNATLEIFNKIFDSKKLHFDSYIKNNHVNILFRPYGEKSFYGKINYYNLFKIEKEFDPFENINTTCEIILFGIDERIFENIVIH